MATYVSVFVYFALISGIIIPSIRVLVRWIQVKLNTKLQSGVVPEFNKSVYQKLAKISHAMLPYIFTYETNTGGELNDTKNVEIKRIIQAGFNIDGIQSRLRIQIVLGVTFGLVYPPLGIVIYISILSHNYLTNIEVEYYACTVNDSIRDVVENCLKDNFVALKLEKQQHNMSVFAKFLADQRAILLMILSCSFMWFFVFDTLGDSIGFETTVLASVLTLILLPLIAFITFAYVKPKLAYTFSTCFNRIRDTSVGSKKSSSSSVISMIIFAILFIEIIFALPFY